MKKYVENVKKYEGTMKKYEERMEEYEVHMKKYERNMKEHFPEFLEYVKGNRSEEKVLWVLSKDNFPRIGGRRIERYLSSYWGERTFPRERKFSRIDEGIPI